MIYDDAYWDEMLWEILDTFDFEKVHCCMVALDWTWAKTNGVPDVVDLRKCARRLLKDCITKGHGGTGGFKVAIARADGVLSLSFVVEYHDAYKEGEPV